MARILLAEDDTSMREYLQRALQRVGYEVDAVGCGTEAMPLLETEQFDLLLTDIVMPEMDGIELAQKASAIDPSIRVMFITGFAAVALQGGRTAPEAKLLSKPFHLKDLVMEVDRMFQTEDQHGRKSRDEHHADRRIDRARLLRELDPVHLRHDDVREEEVELLGLEQRHRFRPATDRDHVIADPLQRPLQIFTHRRIVFGEEDSCHDRIYAPFDCHLPEANDKLARCSASMRVLNWHRS